MIFHPRPLLLNSVPKKCHHPPPSLSHSKKHQELEAGVPRSIRSRLLLPQQEISNHAQSTSSPRHP
ncbi:hypothetical protein BS78_03G013100 [Paspalum vaginatum]|nr:hypothetical protein BS78_03G013100 [Paspalum vaginatum]